MCKQKYNTELEAMIAEVTKFVNAFGYPISQSVPHIYLSALPFSPSKSAVLQRMRAEFRDTLSVEAGTSEQWPGIRQVFTGHSGGVASVAFSPDGTRIVSGSSDTTVRIWDAVSGVPITEPLRGCLGRVLSVSFSPTSMHVVSGAELGVQIWDTVSGKPICEPLQGHSGYVHSVVYSPDGCRIVSGSGDRTVRMWDAVSGAS